LAIEAAVGYPDALLARFGHPVMWMGLVLSRLETRLNRPDLREEVRLVGGVVALVALVIVTVLAAKALSGAVRALPFGGLLEAMLASSLLAQRSLHTHVSAVATALRQGGLEAGRVAVGRIVGRRTASLDEPAVARAAIESLAENFSDGVVAPAFWLAVAGLPGIAFYKAVNTADSMIGHHTPRHESFGWAAARLDDLINLPGARLAGILLAGAARFLPGASPDEAVAVMRRDARLHRSPNSGWPESAMAGALGLRLGGPRRYGRKKVDEAWLGQGRTAATVEDIERALALFRRACLMLMGVAGVLTILL
jgi:adenosylcobinamide-phosphate synthase